MRKSRVIASVAAGLVVLVAGGGLAVGDYIYTTGTKVNCAVNADDLNHTPAEFYTAGKDNGPFPGEGWNKWVDYDLSNWWLTDVPFAEVQIPVADGVELAAWWIAPHLDETKKTVIVTHGIGTSKQDFNTLLPTSMLAPLLLENSSVPFDFVNTVRTMFADLISSFAQKTIVGSLVVEALLG